eukprot:385509-Alexandrium_andersonii.AAC.1
MPGLPVRGKITPGEAVSRVTLGRRQLHPQAERPSPRFGPGPVGNCVQGRGRGGTLDQGVLG